MTRGLPATGHEAQEYVLLAQLGLPASASPEDVDNLHQAASQYLASAPPELRGWAHAQASALDQAYLQLTDPVGLQGSALRSPARPPAVVPGGPATPPVRRGSVPADGPALTAAVAAGRRAHATTPRSNPTSKPIPAADEPDLDDLAVLYASVTPSAHPDMIPGAKPKAKAPAAPAAPARRAGAAATAAAPQAANPWKRLVLAGVAVFAIIGVGFAGMQVVGAIGGGSPTSSGAAQASDAPPAVDAAKIAGLMEKLAANPKDTVTLLALANEYYAGQQYTDAGNWLDKVLAIEPDNVEGLLARGAVSFNLNDLADRRDHLEEGRGHRPQERRGALRPGLPVPQPATPDWAGVQSEWNTVIALDPTSQLAQTVKSHLDSLAAASMIPASSPGASAGASAAPGGSPAASATPGASPAASPAPSASPAASATP